MLLFVLLVLSLGEEQQITISVTILLQNKTKPSLPLGNIKCDQYTLIVCRMTNIL